MITPQISAAALTTKFRSAPLGGVMRTIHEQDDNINPASSGKADEYVSYIADRCGIFYKEDVIPKGFKDGDVPRVDHIVLKPDGDFFNKQFPRVGPGSKKGDVE